MRRAPWSSTGGSSADDELELTFLAVETPPDDDMAGAPTSLGDKPVVSTTTGVTAAPTAAPVKGATTPSAGSGVHQQGSALHRGLHGSQVVLKRTAVVLMYVVALVVGLVLLLLYVVVVLPPKRARRFWGKQKEDEVLTNDWWGLHDGDDAAARAKGRPKEVDMRRGVELRTCYITTRDGVKLATDVWIPVKALQDKKALPVVFHQARYYRSATLRWPFNLIVNGGKPISFINDPFFKSFLSHDMILVSVDVRGTGASFGTHPGPWSPEEQQDSFEVLDWIDTQPWSNGRVALWGVSYEATSAFFTSLLRHPTVVCCCPMFFFWDVYDDISHPGGVPMRYFSVSWQGFNDCLDSGWVQSTGWMARIFLEGVTPVTPEDSWGYQAKQAILGHKNNWSLLNDAHIRYMDDTSSHTGRVVSSACASHALQRLLDADKNRLGIDNGGGAVTSLPSDSPPDSSGGTEGVEVLAVEGEGDVSVGAGLWSRVGSGGMRVGTRRADGLEGTVEGFSGIGCGGEGGGVVGDGGREGGRGKEGLELERSLPFYLHVSGWLDASAHAAIMAFTTVPCRGSELLVGPWSHGGHQHVRPQHITTTSKFDFTTEVSGFFVRRLSLLLPANAACSAATDSSAAGACAPPGVTDPARDAGLGADVSGVEAATPTTAASASASESAAEEDLRAQGVAHDPPTPVSGAAVTEAAAVHSDGDDGDVGEGTALTESTVEATSVLEESDASKALWKRARPRVRYFTHQEERWHDTTEFPSLADRRADVSLFLGGTKQQQQQQQQQHYLRDDDSPPAPAAAAPRETSAEEGPLETTTATAPAGEREDGGTTNTPATEEVDVGVGDNGCPAASEKHQLLSAAIVNSSGWTAEDQGAPPPVSREESGGYGGGRRVGGRKRRRKLSARLREWPPMRFRKHRLTLSQDAGGDQEAETHELVVDINKDHDGEGTSRWAAMTEFWSLISYQMDGMRSNHLRFTSAPLKQDIEVTGYPVVSLWVSAADDLPNLDVFAYLQAVRPRTGLSIYVTEGCFRAEHRKEAERTKPVDVRALPGVPIHSYLRADAEPLEKGKPVEIRFKLSPTSFKFLKGQRIRLSIGGADSRHFHPITDRPPQAPASPVDPQSGNSALMGALVEAATEGEENRGVASGEGLTKRVLRVHTGGPFASSGVILPVPRGGSGAGGGMSGGSAVVRGLGWGLDNLGSAAADGQGKGHGGRASTLSPTAKRSARNLWGRRRTRSLSLPGVERGSFQDGDVAIRRRSEGRLQDVFNDSPGSGGLFEDAVV
eukprot:g17726.t1